MFRSTFSKQIALRRGDVVMSHGWVQPLLGLVYLAGVFAAACVLLRRRRRSGPTEPVVTPDLPRLSSAQTLASGLVTGFADPVSSADPFEIYDDVDPPHLPAWVTRLYFGLDDNSRMTIISTLLATVGIGLHRGHVDRSKADDTGDLRHLTIALRCMYFSEVPCKFGYERLLQDRERLFALVRYLRDCELGDRMVAMAVYFAGVFDDLGFDDSQEEVTSFAGSAQRFRVIDEPLLAYLRLLNRIAKHRDESIEVSYTAWQHLARLMLRLNGGADDRAIARLCVQRDEIVQLYFDQAPMPADRQEEVVEVMAVDLSFRLLVLQNLKEVFAAIQRREVTTRLAANGVLERESIDGLKGLAKALNTCHANLALARANATTNAKTSEE